MTAPTAAALAALAATATVQAATTAAPRGVFGGPALTTPGTDQARLRIARDNAAAYHRGIVIALVLAALVTLAAVALAWPLVLIAAGPVLIAAVVLHVIPTGPQP